MPTTFPSCICTFPERRPCGINLYPPSPQVTSANLKMLQTQKRQNAILRESAEICILPSTFQMVYELPCTSSHTYLQLFDHGAAL